MSNPTTLDVAPPYDQWSTESPQEAASTATSQDAAMESADTEVILITIVVTIRAIRTLTAPLATTYGIKVSSVLLVHLFHATLYEHA